MAESRFPTVPLSPRIVLSLAVALLLFLQACSGCADEDEVVVNDVGEDVGEAVDDVQGEDSGQDVGADTAEPTQGAMLRFAPESDEFFDTPFPSDARLGADGEPDFMRWPGAADNSLLKLWFEAADELVHGWGLISGQFMYFTAPINESDLPASFAESIDTEGTWPNVFLINADPDSANREKLLPIECKFTIESGTYHDANQLACISPFGLVRESNTRYAMVVTSGLRSAGGALPVEASEAMQALLSGAATPGKGTSIEASPYTEALQIIENAGGPAESVVAVNIFTTGDPSARLRKVNRWYDALPEPTVDSERGVEFVEAFDDFVLLQAFYDVPVIQEGERPYEHPPAGNIIWDDTGEPVQVGHQSIRFFLTVPRQAMPEEGFPVLIYMHGSGGRADELMDRGAMPDLETPAPAGSGPGGVVAPYGVAGFAADFNLHGMRHDPPDTSGLMLYNLLSNPRAAVDNFVIGSNEVTLHARLLKGLTIDPQVAPEYLDAGDAADGLIRFDVERFAAMGQSMGSTIGLPALTVDKNIKAGIFSGSGGVLIEVALKSTKPIEVGKVLRQFLRYRRGEELDRFDPILSAVQQVWDFVDPVAHGRHVFLEPHDGVPAKHTLQHSGLEDGYFSMESRAAFSAALGAPLVEPVLEPAALELMAWVGQGAPTSAPVQDNHMGAVTAVVVQYEPSVLDGHNVAYQLDEAKAQYGCFVRSLHTDASPILRAVEESYVESCP